MLRIHVGSFPGGDAKKLRIELVDVVNKPATESDRLPCHARFSVIISLHVPPVGWHWNDPFPAFDEKLPKRLFRTHAAREATAYSNDCNTFFLHGGQSMRRGGLISAACGHVKLAIRSDHRLRRQRTLKHSLN